MSPEYITKKARAKKCVKYSTQIDRENTQLLITYLSIIKPEVDDVIRNLTQTKVNDNQANIRDLPNLQSHGHSLRSCMALKLPLFIHQWRSL